MVRVHQFGAPTEERLDRARQASARAWLRHLAAGIQANWDSAPADFTSQMEKWLAGGQERLEALRLDEEAKSEQRGRAADPNDERREVELRSLGRLFAEGIVEHAPALAGGARRARHGAAELIDLAHQILDLRLELLARRVRRVMGT